MIILTNESKYLQPYIVDSCFKSGEFISIDKQVCGNGFSTAYLNLPIPKGFQNIVIAPTKGVLIEKEKDYKQNPHKYKNKIKFFYKESKETDFENADVLFFVTDSFLGKKDTIINISDRIDKVLIDEVHSVQQQSNHRKKLIDYCNKVKEVFSTNKLVSISVVTATPNLFEKVDIFIDNTFIEPKDIIVTHNRVNTLERVKKDIKEGEKVVVFTNSATLIYKLRNYKGEIHARFIIGEGLSRSLVSLAKVCEIEKEEDSNLTIVSSRGFEGFDIGYKDAKVYFFEDRSKKAETFFISNLYQAINRTRKGAKYIEYCRQETQQRTTKFKDIDAEVDYFINRTDKSIEQKQKTEEIKDFEKFVIIEQDENGNFSLKKNEVAINLYKETRIYDKKFPAPEFNDFIKKRKLNFTSDHSVDCRLRKSVNTKDKVKNLLSNIDYIEKYDLFGKEYDLKVVNLNGNNKPKKLDEYRVLYLKYFEEYLRNKNYKQDYVLTERQEIALDILKNTNEFKQLVREITRAYRNKSKVEHTKNESLAKIKAFKDKIGYLAPMYIIAFANDRIKFPSKWIANRDYNLTTQLSTEGIKVICSAFRVSFLELDIKSCFSRIIYALNNKSLPEDFYGPNKKNKRKINIFLNNFFYRSELSTPKKVQRNNAIIRFRELGFDDDVIKYLIDNFFLSDYKGDLFSKISFFEKKIISDVMKQVNIKNHNEGVVRRHDSCIVFNNKADLSFINEYTYSRFPKITDWFDVSLPKVIALETTNNENEYFLPKIASNEY